MARWKLWWSGLAAACLLAVLLLGPDVRNRKHASTRRPQAAPLSDVLIAPPTDEDDYVGSEACGICHGRIWQTYRQHPMGRSLGATRDVEQIENFEITEFSPPGPRRYRVERTADGMRHHETLADNDGAILYDQGEEVRFALGSGHRGRAYLIEHDEMLFKSSIAWFSNLNEWGLSPGYAPEQHKRFERRIVDGCINCHAGRMSVNRAQPDTFKRPVVVEAAIGCERCHGPGRRHVEAHESAPRTALDFERIVNPAQLESAQRESVCAQCHLHGKATVVRTGQKVFDFRPGQRLEENRIVFVTAPGTAGESAASALSQVEQMHASACFRKSDGQLGCTSCHDPHAPVPSSSRIEFYREKCLVCHESRGCSLAADERLMREESDSCIACHMPPLLHVGNILHVSFADHRVLRSSPSQKAGPTAPAKVVVFDHADERLPKLELDRAIGFMLVSGTGDETVQPGEARRAEKLLLPVQEAYPADIDTLEVLGAACLIQGRVAEAEQWWLDALKLDSRRESVLEHLAVLYHDQRRIPQAHEYLKRYLDVNPWHGSIYGRLAGVLGVLGEWREGIAAAERGLQLNPTLVPLHDWLAHAYRQVGERAESDRHKKMFERMQRRLPGIDRSSTPDREP